MKHCILVTAYKYVASINMLCRILPDNFSIYVHLDRKCAEKKDEIDRRARVISEYKVYWGSYNHIAAICSLMKLAVKEDDYDYFHIITGQDFIAADPGDFDTVLGQDKMNYLGIFPLPRPGWWGDGLDIFRFRTVCRHGDVRRGLWKILNYLLKYFYDFRKSLNLVRKLPDFHLYGGSVYCSLSSEFVNWVLNDSFAHEFMHKLKYSLCGEEIFFQTLIMNSPYSDKVVNDSKRYIVWKDGTPKYIDAGDIEDIKKGNYLFCRKVTDDGAQLKALEKQIKTRQ